MRYKLVVNELRDKIDKETGEVTQMIVRKVIDVKVGSEEKFIMMFVEHIAPMYDLKYANDIKVLLKLCEFAEYESGEVHLSSKRRLDMLTDIKMQQSNVSKSLRRLKDKKLISGENGEYLLNPVIFWKGKRSKRLEELRKKGLSFTFNFMLEENEDDEQITVES